MICPLGAVGPPRFSGWLESVTGARLACYFGNHGDNVLWMRWRLLSETGRRWSLPATPSRYAAPRTSDTKNESLADALRKNAGMSWGRLRTVPSPIARCIPSPCPRSNRSRESGRRCNDVPSAIHSTRSGSVILSSKKQIQAAGTSDWRPSAAPEASPLAVAGKTF